MSLTTYEIGGTPCEEDCAQIGVTADAERYNVLECRAYIEALTRCYGVPPNGSRLTTKSNSHDYGTYREVAYRFDSTVPANWDYAQKVENGLATWREAGMWAPVTYHRSQAIHVIEDIEQLDLDANPQALNAMGTIRKRESAEA